MLSGMSFIWAMKMEATETKSAVPSMLTVAPIGSTNRLTRRSTLAFSSTHLSEMGSVAALQRRTGTRQERWIVDMWPRKHIQSR